MNSTRCNHQGERKRNHPRRTHLHERWVIPAHMADDYVPKDSSSSAHPRRTAASIPRSAPTAPSGSAPFGRIARFLGKAHSALMKAITFIFSQNHDVVTRLITSKNALKACLRDSRVFDVSDDDRFPDAPSSDFGFPSGPEWSDFFDEAGGSGSHDDDDEEGF